MKEVIREGVKEMKEAAKEREGGVGEREGGEKLMWGRGVGKRGEVRGKRVVDIEY